MGLILGGNVLRTRTLFKVVVLCFHFNGETDIVGIFLYQRFKFPLHEIIAVAFVVGVVLKGKGYFRTYAGLFAFLNSVTLNAA